MKTCSYSQIELFLDFVKKASFLVRLIETNYKTRYVGFYNLMIILYLQVRNNPPDPSVKCPPQKPDSSNSRVFPLPSTIMLWFFLFDYVNFPFDKMQCMPGFLFRVTVVNLGFISFLEFFILPPCIEKLGFTLRLV